MIKGAVISECKKYRYSLSRIWDQEKETVTFICLNPSTADAEIDDRTITRCINYAESWGYGGLCMANLFAFRATEPKDMKSAVDPVGPENDSYLIKIASKSKIIVAGWGNDGCFGSRDKKVKQMIGLKLHCLKLTKGGNPWHPLYLKKSLLPIPLMTPDQERHSQSGSIPDS